VSGINLGDVMVQGDDIFGDGVNVAARLEALAEPSGIAVSRVVWDSPAIRGSSSRLTRRWREMDSIFRFRARSEPARRLSKKLW
jgi:class 3 adenylate cyclase